jgi:hypothetical protein
MSGQPFGNLLVIEKSNKHVVFEDHKEHLLSLTNLSEKSNVADYLRSKNFCLHFFGLDPIQEGWAVLENDKTQTTCTKSNQK